MSSTTLFEIPFSEFQLKNAVSSALQQSLNNPTKFSIESNLEAAVRDTIQNSLGNIKQGNVCPFCPPFGGNLDGALMIFFQIGIGYRPAISAGIHAGLEYHSGDFFTNHSLHFSFYNSGIGTSIYKNSKESQVNEFDITAYWSVGIGSGKGVPITQYVTNYREPIPIPNNYKNSGSYGIALNLNSATNKDLNFEKMQRMGVLNLRFNNFSLSTSNDTKSLPYKGGGTDYGHTGHLILTFPVAKLGMVEVGYENFTGPFEIGDAEIDLEALENLNYNTDNSLGLSKRNWKKEVKKNKKNFLKTHYHSQNASQKKLNRAVNFLRVYNGETSIRFDFESKGWLQSNIHDLKDDLKYDYSNENSMMIWFENMFKYYF